MWILFGGGWNCEIDVDVRFAGWCVCVVSVVCCWCCCACVDYDDVIRMKWKHILCGRERKREKVSHVKWFCLHETWWMVWRERTCIIIQCIVHTWNEIRYGYVHGRHCVLLVFWYIYNNKYNNICSIHT